MNKIIILLFFVSGARYTAYCQTDLQQCVQSSFYQQDSTLNHADRFMLWTECVKEKPAPDFSGKTLKGEKIKMKSLRGKIVVLNLWFIDCLPCIKELPALNKLVAEYRGNKDVVFISLTWETKERVEKEFFAKYKLDFEVIPEEMKAVELFGKPGYPTTFVIGKDGLVKAGFLGGPIDDSAETEAYRRVKPVLDALLVK